MAMEFPVRKPGFRQRLTAEDGKYQVSFVLKIRMKRFGPVLLEECKQKDTGFGAIRAHQVQVAPNGIPEVS